MKAIYIFTNEINDKVYVGQTQDIKKRLNKHFSDVRVGRSQKELYVDMRKYGIDKFEFNVIEYVDDFHATEREKYWINHFNSKKQGYNDNYGAAGSCEESHWNAILNEKDVALIKLLLSIGVRQTDLAKRFNVNFRTINNINTGRRWEYVDKLTAKNGRELNRMMAIIQIEKARIEGVKRAYAKVQS